MLVRRSQQMACRCCRRLVNTWHNIAMLPDDFQIRLQQLYGDDGARSVLSTMRAPKAVALWDNPLRAGALDTLAVDLAASGRPIGEPALAGLMRFEADHRKAIMHHRLVGSGALYPINPSSLIAAQSLGVRPGDEVLDLAAAPGGKALLLAADLMLDGQATGRLAVVESVKPRFHRMRANLARCGVQQVDYYLRDGRGVGRAVPERFDRVLLDAPCSSEARFHASEPGSWGHWSVRKVRECARKQRGLIDSAFRALKPGGTLVYCTCAMAPEENELVIAWLLRRYEQAFLKPLQAPGVPSAQLAAPITHWGGREVKVSGVTRVLPDDLWDGFFLARLGKH